jgi:hypothetical protein
MRTSGGWRAAALACAAVGIGAGVAAWAAPAAAQDAGGGGSDEVAVELNKLEPWAGGCRSYFLLRNASEDLFTGFELSIALMDRDGVVERLLTVDAAPVPARRTTLKVFELEGLDCDAVGEVIVYDMPACEIGGAPAEGCFARLALSSRAGAPLVD